MNLQARLAAVEHRICEACGRCDRSAVQMGDLSNHGRWHFIGHLQTNKVKKRLSPNSSISIRLTAYPLCRANFFTEIGHILQSCPHSLYSTET
ncbi:hypothetical protein D3C74_122940 [compost metagenome]